MTFLFQFGRWPIYSPAPPSCPDNGGILPHWFFLCLRICCTGFAFAFSFRSPFGPFGGFAQSLCKWGRFLAFRPWRLNLGIGSSRYFCWHSNDVPRHYTFPLMSQLCRPSRLALFEFCLSPYNFKSWMQKRYLLLKPLQLILTAVVKHLSFVIIRQNLIGPIDFFVIFRSLFISRIFVWMVFFA